MSRFFLGDELGNIKTLRYSPQNTEGSKYSVTPLYRQEGSTNMNGVQWLSSSPSGAEETSTSQVKLAAAFSNGSCFISTVKEDDSHEIALEWKEPRIVASDKFIGMSIRDSSAYTCTSNGMLRRTPFTLEKSDAQPESSQSQSTTIPSRLWDWRLSENGETFAYGGEEVELSVWNAELAFQPQQKQGSTGSAAPSKKRKRNDDLFPAEIWRARNLPNDSLNLRQPIRITALTYLSSSSTSHHLLTGTQFGDLRRYDTRAARRPVSNWISLGKIGGVKSLEKGLSEHEIFMSDNGFNLSSIDLRTGGILYNYKGLSGAVTSIAQSPTILASVALDRYARVHSVIAPPATAQAHQERKGEVLEKLYLTSTPTTIVWDKCTAKKVVENLTEDEIWENMEHIS